jgi:hypothetical protein
MGIWPITVTYFKRDGATFTEQTTSIIIEIFYSTGKGADTIDRTKVSDISHYKLERR